MNCVMGSRQVQENDKLRKAVVASRCREKLVCLVSLESEHKSKCVA
jgi:hypothetical protein